MNMKKILSRIYHSVLQCTRKVRINGKFIKTKHYGSEYGGFNVYIPDAKKKNGGYYRLELEKIFRLMRA